MVGTSPRIAIVGAGLSGVTCGRILQSRQLDVTIFEKSRGAGGRMSTRRSDELRFDHGAQYFTARDPLFIQEMESWIRQGHVQLWDARIAVIGRSDQLEMAEPGTNRYVATPDMNSLCKYLSEPLRVVTETRVAKIARFDQRWKLTSTDGVALGDFHAVLISTPSAQAAELLTEVPELARQATSCPMNPCWSAMLAFEDRLAMDFDGAFVHNSPITWVARNNSKPQRPPGEAWVIHASNEWTEARLDLTRKQVLLQLLGAFQELAASDLPSPVHSAAHLWRFAIPPHPLRDRCVMDEKQLIAACGDWCGGPRIEGAYLSGVEAASRIIEALEISSRETERNG